MKTTIQNPTHTFLAIAFCLAGLPLATATAQTGVGINTNTPKSDLEVNGSFGVAVTTLSTANATLDATTKSMVVCNNASTPITVTLPDATACAGRMYTIKKGTLSTGSVHINGTSSQTIDGNLSYMLMNKDQSVTVFSNGTEWKTIGKSNEPFPMGEINYFSTTGASTTFSAASDGTTNMVLCTPATSLTHGMDFSERADGQLQYNGDRPKHFHIACTISASSAGQSAKRFVFGVAKNGTVLPASKVLQKIGGDVQSTALHVAIEMQKGDYLDLRAGNTDTTEAVTLYSLTLFALGME